MGKAKFKSFLAAAIGAFCAALAREPQMAKAQETESAAPARGISAASVSAALRAVTANGTRPGAENSRALSCPPEVRD